MREIVVIGGNGQLGTDLVAACSERGLQVRALTHARIAIDDMASVQAALADTATPIVINAAACHGARMETVTDQQAFFNVNALGAWNLARWCSMHDAILVHYSTDYVFGAEQARHSPYREEDCPCPVSVYGASKLAGEHLIRVHCPAHYVIRIASVYGRTGSRAKGHSNFVHGMLDRARRGETLHVVADQIISPTWTEAVAGKTLDLLIAEGDFGLYHMAGSGACSWYDFAREIVRMAGLAVPVEPTITPEEAPDGLVRRPRFTALDNARLRQAGLGDLPHWRDALATYLGSTQRR